MMPSLLTYRDSDHSYQLGGEKVPSVTTCTGVLNKPGLVPWAAKLGAMWARDHPELAQRLSPAEWEQQAKRAPTVARDKAGQVGTDLHAAANLLTTTGVAPDVPQDQLALVLQAADFLDSMGVETIASERAVYHDTFRYAGRFDLIGQIRSRVWLLDFKTSASGVWPEMALQQSAYRYASHMQADDPRADDVPMVPISHVGIVWVRPEGWQLVPLLADRDVWQSFLATIPLWHFSRRRDVVQPAMASSSDG